MKSANHNFLRDKSVHPFIRTCLFLCRDCWELEPIPADTRGKGGYILDRTSSSSTHRDKQPPAWKDVNGAVCVWQNAVDPVSLVHPLYLRCYIHCSRPPYIKDTLKGHTCDNCQPASISKNIYHSRVEHMANLSAPADPFHLCTKLLQTDSDKLAHFYVYQLVGIFRQSKAQFYIIK